MSGKSHRETPANFCRRVLRTTVPLKDSGVATARATGRGSAGSLDGRFVATGCVVAPIGSRTGSHRGIARPLCEVAEQSLYVAGGVLARAAVMPPGRSIGLYLIALMQAGPDDPQKPHRAKVIFSDWALNEAVLVDQEVSFDAHGGENHFWVWPLRGNCASGPGRYVFKVTIDGTSISVPLAVHDVT